MAIMIDRAGGCGNTDAACRGGVDNRTVGGRRPAGMTPVARICKRTPRWDSACVAQIRPRGGSAMQRRNLTARAATWSARHRRIAILGWMAFVVAAVVLGSAVGTKHIASNNDGVGESARADQIINAKFPQYAGEQVLIQSKKLTAADPQFQAAVRDVVKRVAATRTVQDLRSPLAPANRGEISRDGHSALVSFQIAGDQSHADDQVGASLAAT